MQSRRSAPFVTALTLFLCLALPPAALAKSQVGSISGVVVAERERDESRRELLVAVPALIEGTPVTDVRIEVGRKYAKTVTPGPLPEGWTMTVDGKWVVFAGPPQNDAIALTAKSDTPFPDNELEMEIGSGDETLAEGEVPVRDYELPEAPKDPDELVDFPQVVPAQGEVGFGADDDELPPGEWSVGDTKATPAGEENDDKYSMNLDLTWSKGMDLGLKYTDHWGETYVDGLLDEVEVVPAEAVTDEGPRLTDCSPKVLTGGTLCVCGYFPTLKSRDSLSIDGTPLGIPWTASPWILTFKLPDVPPGEFVVEGPEAAGYPPGSAVTGLHIRVGGEIDSDKLRRGESTPLRLWMIGTDEPMTLRLWNDTPGIVSLEGGEDQQVTTSGGSPNQVTRTVSAVSPGDFILNYELAGDWCPCAETLAETVMAELGESGGSTVTTSTTCKEGSINCEQLRELAETAARAASEARAEARRLEANRPWVQQEAETIRDATDSANAYADTLRRQADDWRELAESAREMAAECRRRDKELPGNDWDHWAEVYERDAKRRDENAERAEAEADAAEGKAQSEEERVEQLEESIDEATAAAEAAEELAAKARAAFEACAEKLKDKCPGVETGAIVYTGPVVIEGPGGVPEEIDPSDPEAKICGPDVTALVLEVLDFMIEDFNDAPEGFREKACENINTFQRDEKGRMIAEYAWDIFALSPAYAPESEDAAADPERRFWFEGMSDYCAHPRWPCGPTVTFFGQCIHAQVVNYIQWGAMNELCDTHGIAGINHWGRATVGGVRSTVNSRFESWQWKSAHYEGQKHMSELGIEFVKQRRGDAGKSRESIADELAAELARITASNVAWPTRMSAQCAPVCRLSAAEAQKLRERLMSPGGTRPYTWVGLDGDQPPETGRVPRERK